MRIVRALLLIASGFFITMPTWASVLSTFDGFVLDVSTQPGEFFDVDQSSPLVGLNPVLSGFHFGAGALNGKVNGHVGEGNVTVTTTESAFGGDPFTQVLLSFTVASSLRINDINFFLSNDNHPVIIYGYRDGGAVTLFAIEVPGDGLDLVQLNLPDPFFEPGNTFDLVFEHSQLSTLRIGPIDAEGEGFTVLAPDGGLLFVLGGVLLFIRHRSLRHARSM